LGLDAGKPECAKIERIDETRHPSPQRFSETILTCVVGVFTQAGPVVDRNIVRHLRYIDSYANCSNWRSAKRWTAVAPEGRHAVFGSSAARSTHLPVARVT
jgi:hypothetical protein